MWPVLCKHVQIHFHSTTHRTHVHSGQKQKTLTIKKSIKMLEKTVVLESFFKLLLAKLK